MIVQNLNGEAVCLNVDVSLVTFGNFQRLIAEQPKLNVPKGQKRLIHAGRVLESHDSQVLERLGIEEDSIIHVCNAASSCPIFDLTIN